MSKTVFDAGKELSLRGLRPSCLDEAADASKGVDRIGSGRDLSFQVTQDMEVESQSRMHARGVDASELGVSTACGDEASCDPRSYQVASIASEARSCHLNHRENIQCGGPRSPKAVTTDEH